MSAPIFTAKCASSERNAGNSAEPSARLAAREIKLHSLNPFFLRILLLAIAVGTMSSAYIAQPNHVNPPTNLTASATSATQMNLAWSAPQAGQNPVSYTIWRCQGANCQTFAKIASISASGTTYQDAALSASTTYAYQVRSVNSKGASSSPSNTATATTLAATSSTLAPPVITSSTTAGGVAGSSFSYQISATNSPTSYGASGLPSGLAINSTSGLISGTPASSGTFSVNLSATNGGGTGSATLALSVSSPLQAQIAASPSSVSFGTVTDGTTDSVPITLNNNGNTTLTFSQIGVTGAGFAQTGLSTSLTIPAGGSTTFNATFDPLSAGTVSGSITLTTNGTPSPLAIGLSGTGQAVSVQLSASPTSLSFGNILDQSSSQLTASVTNNGNSNVTISGVTITGAGFTASGLLGGTVLLPGQSVPLTVTFAPTSGGSVSGSVSIASDATNSPATVSLSGAGMHSVVLSWNASPTTGVTYNVFRGTASGGESTTPINSAPVTALTLTDANVTPGTTYYYTVEAVDSAGSSPASNEASAIIPSP
jgi:archaellum component FlaF (FlaF/FlaG flagellin family)